MSLETPIVRKTLVDFRQFVIEHKMYGVTLVYTDPEPDEHGSLIALHSPDMSQAQAIDHVNFIAAGLGNLRS